MSENNNNRNNNTNNNNNNRSLKEEIARELKKVKVIPVVVDTLGVMSK